MSRTYTGIIDQDFNEVKELIKSQTTNYELEYESIFRKLKLFHSYFYKLRDILEELDYQNDESYNAIQDGVEGIFDFIWLLVLSRYKSSAITFRSSIEILVKGLMREYCPERETDKFSNNIEIIISEFKLGIRPKLNSSNHRRKLSKFLEQNYAIKIRALYKSLSGIVHGNYISIDKRFSEYLQEITQVDINYSAEQYNGIIDESTNLLRFILELTIMINFEYLNRNMNSYKLNLILDSLSSDFKELKRNYLSIYF